MSTSSRSHPLEAIPIRSEAITQQIHPEAGSLLTMKLTPAGRMHRWIARWLGRQMIRVELDPRGTAFWGLVDDQRSLREISRELAALLGIEERDCQKACTLYTADLVRRGFLHLSIPNPST